MSGFSSDFSEYTVLVVDDISLNVLLLQKSLQRFNFNIVTANSGREALEVIAAIKPAIVFLDVMMPGMDGLAVLKAIRQNPANDDIRVVMVSALASEADIDAAKERGANAYITKPIVMATLMNVVMQQVEAYKESQNK